MDLGLIVLALPLFLALGVSLARSWRGETWALVTALCLVVVYLRVSSRFEGALLVRFTSNHGLVVADLFGLALAGLACFGWWRARHRSAGRLRASAPR
jgi:hypothetical protein